MCYILKERLDGTGAAWLNTLLEKLPREIEGKLVLDYARVYILAWLL